MISVYETESKPFEDSRVAYTPVVNTDHVQFNVSGHNNYYSGLIQAAGMCITPAQEIGCKMASADRVAQQLGLSSEQYDGTMTCADMNQYAIDLAEQILGESSVGQKTLKRFQQRGRRICLGKDFTPTGNIGPLFIKEKIKVKDDSKNHCLSVESEREGPTGLHSLIFPGIHYCKLLSPARVIEYYMTDSLKDTSTCLNTNSLTAEQLVESFLEILQ